MVDGIEDGSWAGEIMAPEWEGVEATFTRKETSGQTFLRPLSFDLQHLRIAPVDYLTVSPPIIGKHSTQKIE